jgi:hypothetical protein
VSIPHNRQPVEESGGTVSKEDHTRQSRKSDEAIAVENVEARRTRQDRQISERSDTIRVGNTDRKKVGGEEKDERRERKKEKAREENLVVPVTTGLQAS